MQPNHLVPPYLPSALATSSSQDTISYGVLHSIPFHPHSSTCQCSLQCVIGLVEASGFCYTINTYVPSPELLFDILLLPCVDPPASDLQDLPLHTLQQLMDGVDAGEGQLRALDLRGS